MTISKKISLLTILTASGLCYAQGQTSYLIDFNDAGGSGGPGGTWNVYGQTSEVNGSVIVDSTGTSSSITLSQSGTLTRSTNSGALVFNNPTGGPSWVTTDGSLANTGAAGDYFFSSTSVTASFTITYGNLNEGDSVNLDVWTSRQSNNTGIGFYSYSLDGGTNWFGFNVLEKNGSASTALGNDGVAWNTTDTLGQEYRGLDDGNNAARYMNINSLTIGSAGTLQVKAQDISGAQWTAIGAMRLTVIPEPSTYALISGVLGLACVVFSRRAR